MPENTRWSRLIFRILLAVYSTRIRRDHREDMWHTFRDELQDARALGTGYVLKLWRREITALWHGHHANISAHQPKPTHQHVPGAPNRMSMFGVSSLDFRLGFRMLTKNPGMTVVAVFAMAIGMAVGTGYFEFVHDFIDADLPVEEGDRIVGLWNFNASTQSVEPQSLHDFVRWRDELLSVSDLGAATSLGSNLITEDGRAEPVIGVAISASAFRVVSTPPLLGRPLLERDEAAGAPSVVVIGHELWQTRFGGDPGVIGRTIQLGNTERGVVGVMPDGFAFPYNHDLWVPFQQSVLDHERGAGPVLQVIFGRLATGFTLKEAQAELTAVGARAATDFPESNQYLRPYVAGYTESFMLRNNDPGIRAILYGLQALLLMILVVACVNVATLVFARTAAREGEIVVRRALGASRGRIIKQLFVEALVLAAVAGIVALAVTSWGTRWGLSVAQGLEGASLPFWWNNRLSPASFVVVGILVLGAAVITGILPALKVTGRRARNGLQRAMTYGSRLRFGAFSTGLIVIQVAASVSLLSVAIAESDQYVRVNMWDLGFPTDEYLSAQLQMDRDMSPSGVSGEDRQGFTDRYTSAFAEVARRVRAEPGVTAVTYADRLPATVHTRRLVESDIGSPNTTVSHPSVRVAHVAPDFFEALTVSAISGRSFHSGDITSDRSVVIVNQSFAVRILADQNPIGSSVRYVAPPNEEPGPWYRIVGVVPDLAMSPEESDVAGIYHPVQPGDAYPVHIVARVGKGPTTFAQRLRAITLAVDPAVQVRSVRSMADVVRSAQMATTFFVVVSSLVAAMVVLLAAAGTYALMSFTISQRTREIGIRTALGAHPRRVLTAVFGRSLGQLGLGMVVGAGLPGLGVFGDWSTVQFAAICAIMMVVGFLACTVPAVRALRIQPTDALREVG